MAQAGLFYKPSVTQGDGIRGVADGQGVIGVGDFSPTQQGRGKDTEARAENAFPLLGTFPE